MKRWGILGAGNIAKRFIEGLSYVEDGMLYAIASRTKSKRDAYKHSGCIVYDDYYDLLNDENVDVVYIALPYAMHYEYAKEALLRHKHVLCEKPATLSYKETKELCELSKVNNVLFLEGMKSRFIPLIQILKEYPIGSINRIETAFLSDTKYDENCYLFDKVQGGALYDVGIYNIAKIIDFIHSDIKEVKGYVEIKDGIDYYDEIELIFDSGQSALIRCGINKPKDRSMTIYSDTGILKASPFYRPTQAYFNDILIEKDYDYDDFCSEIKEVHYCIDHHRYESERMSHRDTLRCIEIIEMIREKFYG